MILDTLNNLERYAALHPLFPRVIAFIRSTNLSALTAGIHPIIDKQLFVIVEEAQGRSRDVAKLECHRRYIDIQLVLEGIDEMGWKPLVDCKQPVSDYNEERDIRFFNDETDTWISTPADSFCIFFPDDAHAPLVSTGMIRKLIFKIAVDAVL
ncbi:MAG TPA: YhcH/YjgK/YiaL family protein [Gallionellaceae bacterium]|nr:YhcH/YjgK/YiaL family protein [Gallionellaceae bacterium]